MAYRKNTRRDAELRALVDEGVMAGAELAREAVKEEFAARNDGFVHGFFATGEAADIQIDGPYTRRGVRRADVYSPAARMGTDGVAYYPAMWEFGHWNVFTGRYERVETFGPAMAAIAGQLAGVMARQIQHAAVGGGLTRKTGGIQTSVRLRDFGL